MIVKRGSARLWRRKEILLVLGHWKTCKFPSFCLYPTCTFLECLWYLQALRNVCILSESAWINKRFRNIPEEVTLPILWKLLNWTKHFWAWTTCEQSIPRSGNVSRIINDSFSFEILWRSKQVNLIHHSFSHPSIHPSLTWCVSSSSTAWKPEGMCVHYMFQHCT